MKEIKIGVIGCGYWGPNLIRNFSQIDSTELYYVCDLDESKMVSAKKTYPSVKTTANFMDVINDPLVDAVVVALPVAKHYPIAKEALLNGKHVLLEKPMTSSSSEAEELIKIASEKNLILMVDHTFEYSQPIRMIKEIISKGDLGDIYYMRADWLNLGLLQPDVNVIWDLATHVISIINFVSGMTPERVSANGGGYIRNDIPEVANLHIKYAGGARAYATVSWVEPKKTRSLTIVGSKKMLVYDLMNEEEPIKIYDKGVDLTKEIENPDQHRIDYRYGDVYSPNVKNIEPLKTMCQHFANCVLGGDKPISDGLSGLNVVKVLEFSEESLKRGEEISLNDQG